MKMKIPKLFPRKKLRASVASRRSLRASAEAYDEMDEPNMKLSRALLIVLLLHVVAVSGIVAFNAIKTRQDSYVKPEVAPIVRQNAEQRGENVVVPHSTAAPLENAKPTTRPSPKLIEHPTKPADSGKAYIVVKGDNPATIAKKFKVSYDDLIQLNHISDPRRLQIGQKLLIPKSVKAKGADD